MSGAASTTRALLRLAVVAGALLAGCGRGGEERDAIRFVSLAWQEQAIDANKEIVAAWNADTTRTPVEYVQGTWGSVHDFLITAFETGDVPDVFHYEAVNTVDFARRGNLADLGPLLSDSLRADVLDVAWETVRTGDGAVTGVPFLLDAFVVLYNRELFERAGVEPPTVGEPWTWAQLRRAARRLTRDTDGDGETDQWGAAFGLRNSSNIVLNLSLGFGGGYFRHGGDGVRVEVGPAEKALLRTIHDMMHRDRTAPTAGVGMSGTDLIPGFLDGDYAMLVGIGSWARQQVVENAPDGFAWGVLPPPSARTQRQGANAQTLSIPAASPHREEAMAFIEFFLSSQNMTRLARSDWMIPARRSSIAALASEPEAHGWTTTLAVANDLVRGPWMGVPGLTEWKGRIATPTFQEVFSGRLSIDAAAARIEDDSERILGRYR
jgi:ABC-type glycerol-3-phosphate transport system substrate-binding protein